MSSTTRPDRDGNPDPGPSQVTAYAAQLLRRAADDVDQVLTLLGSALTPEPAPEPATEPALDPAPDAATGTAPQDLR